MPLTQTMINAVIRTVRDAWYPYKIFLLLEYNTIQTAMTNMLASCYSWILMIEERYVIFRGKEMIKNGLATWNYFGG